MGVSHQQLSEATGQKGLVVTCWMLTKLLVLSVSDRVKREELPPPPRRVAQVLEAVCAYRPLLRPEGRTQWEYC